MTRATKAQDIERNVIGVSEVLTELPRLYSLKEASDAGYGGVQTLHRAIKDGRLRAFRVGRNFKVTAETLADYAQPIEAEVENSPR